MNIDYFMNEAIIQAMNAFDNQEVPVGGILVDINTNEIIAKSYNRVNKEKNAIYHCEIDLIINACKKLSSKYLNNTVLEQSKTAGMRLSFPAKINLIVSTDK